MQDGAPQQPWGAGAPGWAPPPKPGLVPLRPLTLGDILGAAFRVFRRNPRTTLGTSLLFNLASFLVTAGITAGAAFFAYSRISGALPQDRDAIVPGTIAGAGALLIVPLFLSIAVQAILQGVFVLETSHQVVGEKMRLRGLLRQARGRIWALIGWVLLLLAAGIVGVGVLGGVITLLVVLGGRAGTVIGVLIGVVGFFGIIVVAVWIGTKTALVPSILLLERSTVRRAIARSWHLTTFSFWRVFGIIALVAVIVSTASNVASAPVSFIAQIGGGLLQPNGSVSDTGQIVTFVVVTLIGNLITVLISAIGAVIQSSTVALLYIDLRIRREGLDLELLRYVELRSAGVTPLPDPYRTPEPFVAGPGGGPARRSPAVAPVPDIRLPASPGPRLSASRPPDAAAHRRITAPVSAPFTRPRTRPGAGSSTSSPRASTSRPSPASSTVSPRASGTGSPR
ncbi:hypothetical protein [Frondihabitans sucicola]|uniref:hypothetical protein n=1 Tax=Frondihabitans sucicola TaxID=1268041 RepID=UPI0025741618|nr:hypothetical protein [Frondihabitans sucicola]